MRRFPILLLALALCAYGGDTATVSLLATTDMHGNIYPVDYFNGKPVTRGLAKAATLIREARRENPNSVLIDCGDTIQGSPLEYAYQTLVRTGKGPNGLPGPAGQPAGDPMMLAMNRIGYDAMAVGNHEYNFGLKNFNRARGDAKFPWLSANTQVAPGGKERAFDAYIVKTVGGVKVAIIGITTPAVPNWEKPENMGSYRFGPALEAVRKAVAELKAKHSPDIIVAAIHAGMGRDLRTGEPEEPAENVVYPVANAVPELDAIVFGHSHRELKDTRIGNVLVIQPKNYAASVARIDFTLAREGSRWKVTGKQGRLLPVTEATPAAADVLEVARPCHELAERYLAMPVARSPRDLDAALGRVEDNALVDAVQNVQLFYTKADVSFTALFNPRLKVPAGPVTVRQIAALYPYDNELYLVEGNGKMVKDALENAARYYLSCAGARCEQAPLVNTKVAGFNYDVAEGVEYEIDLTRPEGDRVRNLRWKGKPLAPDQPLKVAVNNYRAAGSAGYGMFKGAKILWHSQEEIREMIVRYYSEKGALPGEPSGNWKVLPEAARRTLERQAIDYAHRPDAY
jgi:2',3'-cyclic-nucleotide 2'-phosphodiesterase / 3'-nucleotidase